jgi:hypothetical protein
MATTRVEEFRQLVGEPIPEGGSEGDTLFTDAYIEEILLGAGGNMNRAAYRGWQVKAAHYAGLVNVIDGNAAREFGQLLKNAQDMMKVYQKSTGSHLTDGRARVGRIVRRT